MKDITLRDRENVQTPKKIEKEKGRERKREIESQTQRNDGGEDGDERDDKAGGRIKLLSWDLLFLNFQSYCFHFIFATIANWSAALSHSVSLRFCFEGGREERNGEGECVLCVVLLSSVSLPRMG